MCECVCMCVILWVCVYVCGRWRLRRKWHYNGDLALLFVLFLCACPDLLESLTWQQTWHHLRQQTAEEHNMWAGFAPHVQLFRKRPSLSAVLFLV